MMFMYAFGAMAFFCNPFCITRVYASKSYRFVGWSMSAVALMEMIIKMPGMLLGLQGAANLPDVAPGDLFGEVSLELMGRGYDFSGLEGAAGTSYQGYTIERVDCWIEQNTEACCPGESWPVISYTVHLGRASYYYVRRSRGASNRRGETRVSPRLSGRSPVRARRAPRRSWW